MTFAQALARIEELLKPGMTREPDFYHECQELFMEHADSIVQLGKIAERVRDCCVEIRDQHYASLDNELCLKTDWALNDYDKLMKVDGDE